MSVDGTPSPVNPEAWIGRQELRHDVLTAGPLDRLAALLDRPERYATGDVAPELAHWLHFLPNEPQSRLGPNGHARHGEFLPPLDDLPRRMWAGSRLIFPGCLRVGMELERRSTIASVNLKRGKAGPLAFVTVRHEIGEKGKAPLVIDEHDIVYRGHGGPAVNPAATAPADAVWKRSLTPDAVMLFRYSALTYNSHRIHYDRDYVTRVEAYPGLVVHGPLIATLLLELVWRHLPGVRVTAFSFRAQSPLFDGSEMTVFGMPPDANGVVKLWAASAKGGLAMTADALVGDGNRSVA